MVRVAHVPSSLPRLLNEAVVEILAMQVRAPSLVCAVRSANTIRSGCAESPEGVCDEH